MTLTLRKSLNVPNYNEPVYPCDRLNKVITLDNIQELTRQERFIAKSDINEAILSLDKDLDVAQTRSELPPDHWNYQPCDANWHRRARTMRDCLCVLHSAIRKVDGETEPSDIEKRAARIVRKKTRAGRRRLFHANVFVSLVEEAIGREATDELLRKAAVIADDLAESDQSTPVVFYQEEDQ